MSRITRHRDAAYWVHSAPDDERLSVSNDLPTLERYTEAAMRACPGVCNRTWKRRNPMAMSELRMASATRNEPVPYVPDDHVVRRAWDAMVSGQPIWCEECAAEIRSALGEMESLAVACANLGNLSGQLAPAPMATLVENARQKLAAPPSPSPAFDMVDLILRWPTEWGSRSFSGLQNRLPELLSGPEARHFGHAALDLLRRARYAAGEDELVHHMPAPCIACGRKFLQRADGSETIECARCGKTLAMPDYQAYAAAYRASLGEGETA